MKKILVEIVSGPEGECLVVGNKDGGTRVAGPKPWGGGTVSKRFEVDVERLAEAIKTNMFEEAK